MNREGLMKKALLLLLLVPLTTATIAEATVPASFAALLEEAELDFHRPDGFVDVPAASTPVMDWEHALRSSDGQLEIRLAIRPLKRMQIDYDDPHGAVPDPNHIFPLVFESMASRLAGGGHAPSNPYPPEQAREHFNADWAAAAVFDTTADFATEHSQGLLVAIHRNTVSDAYLVFLFDDYAAVRERLNGVLGTLVFQASAAPTEQAATPDT